MIRPTNNNCLIELVDEYEGVVYNNTNSTVQKGTLKRYGLTDQHLTTSTGHTIPEASMEDAKALLDKMLGCTVYWQEYADAGSKFKFDGKQYVLVPYYRLIGFEE